MKPQYHLAPTAAPVLWQDIGRAALGLVCKRRYRNLIEEEMRQCFGVKNLFLLSSGKAALVTILRALASRTTRRKVIIPAYTCYSVPSAIVRAGCTVALCDVDPHTLDFDFTKLKSIVGSDTLCIVSSHLLGHVADVERAQAIAKPYAVPVVEDAAQALGGRHKGRWLGTQGDIGFFSLGRGKQLTAGSGGIILTESDDLASRLSSACQEVPEASIRDQAANLFTVVGMKLLIHPWLYWLPAGLPFLKLGESIFDVNFAINRFDESRAGLLLSWRQRLNQAIESRSMRVDEYLYKLNSDVEPLNLSRCVKTAYLRLPLIMSSAEDKQRLCTLATNKGLGVSPLYPSPVSQIPQFKMLFEQERFPGAELLAGRLVTLPVHVHVAASDITRICELLHPLVNGIPWLPGMVEEQSRAEKFTHVHLNG